MKTQNPREAAFLAVWASLKNDSFVSELLEHWQNENCPKNLDFNLAKEIACGAIRMALSLDYIAKHLTEKQKIHLKLKEKALLRTAIYQFFYMDRMPAYAITNESILLAKKYCHSTFVGFLNAILRKLSIEKPPLPAGNSIANLSIRYSYPEYFVEQLVHDHDLRKAIEIMQSSNKPQPLMFRIRNKKENDVELLEGTSLPMGLIKNHEHLLAIAASPDCYIQNVTPSELIFNLSDIKNTPKRILDLCSSPGGKLIALHDRFPHAELFANDVSKEKLKPLEENLHKYAIAATVTCSRGENYKSDKPFDLIVLDVPCSNSGVLNKRPEARWRITSQNMADLENLQMELIKNAVSLLSQEGEIWFLTCSILKSENTQLMKKASQLFSLKIRSEQTIFPNESGWDGGFGCVLSKH